MNNFIFDTKQLPIEQPENIYYSKKYNRFFQVKGRTDDYILIGGLCEYYSSCMTVINRTKVSYNFFKEAIPVKNVDEFADYDGTGWKIK